MHEDSTIEITDNDKTYAVDITDTQVIFSSLFSICIRFITIQFYIAYQLFNLKIRASSAQLKIIYGPLKKYFFYKSFK